MKDKQLLPSGENLWNKNSSSSITTPSTVNSTNSKIGSNLKQSSQPQTSWSEKTANVRDLVFTVHSVEISKDVGGLQKPDSYPDDIKFDENGTITSAHSYVRIQVSIESCKETDEILSLNNNQLEIYNSNQLQHSYELMTMNANGNKTKNRDYFHYKIKPKEKQTFTFAYITDDKSLVKDIDLVLKLNPYGQGGGRLTADGKLTTITENISYIRINSFLKDGILK